MVKHAKICGWCGKEIDDKEGYFQYWQNGKLIGQHCKKCMTENRDLAEHLREMP
jgi:hypothetical protein